MERRLLRESSFDRCTAPASSSTRRHFAYEEELLAHHGYPGCVEHIEEHKQLVRQVFAFQQKVAAREATVTMELVRFLKDWLIKHILGSDRQYSAPEGTAGGVTMASVEQIAAFVEELCTSDHLDRRLAVDGSDARLERALNAFLDKLWLQGFQLQAKQEMLEQVVQIRTKEVHDILDHVTGFLIALRDETVLGNHSRFCTDIFGPPSLEAGGSPS